jgi:ATP-dependent Clp protease ATP-binding subunit ClpA
MREALELGHEKVHIEHLLLGLLREDKGIGAQALRSAGLELEAARAIVIKEAINSPKRRRDRRPSRLLLRFLDWAGWAPRK